MASVALILAILLALLWPVETSDHDRLQQAFWQFLHFPAMAVAVWVLAGLFSGRARPIGMAVMLLAVTVPILELLQPLTGRTASLGDVLMGWAGMLAGAAILDAFRVRNATRRWLAGMVIAVLTLGAMAPSLAVIVDRHMAERAFPLLASFRTPLEIGRWNVNGCDIRRVRDHAEVGEHALRIRLKDDMPYPGLFMKDFIVNWSGAGALVLELYVPEDNDLHGWVRIDDRHAPPYADRFQQEVELMPGRNVLRIPLNTKVFQTPRGRSMEGDAIHSWGFFFDRTNAGREVYLDAAYLVMDQEQ